MCITMRVAWLTIDRLRSGRDIRLSTATMRALNSRRLRSPSVHRLVPRPILCFLLLLYVFQNARARSVPHDDDGGLDQVHGKISATVEASDPNLDGTAQEAVVGDVHEEVHGRSLTEDVYVGHDGNEDDSDVVEGGRDLGERLVGEPEKMRIEIVADEGNMAKKRRRNDVSLVGDKSVLQDGEGNPQKDEGIRRFDAQVESDDSEALGQRKTLSDGIAEDLSHLYEDVRLNHQRGSIDVKRSHGNVKNADRRNDEDGARPEGEIYAEISGGLRERLEDVDVASSAEKINLSKEEAGQLKNSAAVNVDKTRIEKIGGDEEVRNDLRRLELALELGDSSERSPEEHVVEEVATREEDPDVNREQRHLAGVPGKSKYKSSTVYLSAEEGGTPGRDQESIVDGQIKRLISIRDDALESAGDGVKVAAKLDDDALLPGRSVGIDVVGGEENEEIRNQRNSDTKNTSVLTESLDRPSLTTETGLNRLQAWKDQAEMLQEQIRNRTSFQYLREQTIENMLPDIPRFTENQLLETLRNIWQSRARPISQPNETFSTSLNTSALSHEQLEIIKCAEQLLETQQRQSFVENMTECIRSLSVLNCMRIFIWPIVLDNMPESVTETLNNLPIEINLMDLFQRQKAARSESSAHQPRFLTPESVVFAILKNSLDSKTTYYQGPIYIDFKNETLRRLLTFGQVQILQMAERLLPGEARREYSDRMFSCVRRFEYFSCVKYFAWPMVRQYHADLPDFPDYQTWYPPVAFYPQYPIVPFPSFVETSGELPEVVDADATRMRRPKPEAVIVNILQNTLKEHAKVPPPSVAHNVDSYVALLPPEQLLSIRMAEQLLPTPYRPEFVQKTVRCIQEFNYMTCVRYSIWPTVKQSNPGLPDITFWLPNLSIPQVFGSYLPELPNFSDYIPSFISGLGGGSATPTTEQPPQSGDSTSQEQSGRFPTILFRQHEISSTELENKITEILMRVRNSLKAIPENSQLVISGNVIILTTITDKQINILKLAESILPPTARAPLVNQVLACLQTNNDFINCTKYIVWPTMALYVPNLPEFPSLPPNRQPPSQEGQQALLKDNNTPHQISEEQREQWHNSRDAANPNVKIISRTKYPQSNTPVISVTGTRFVPIFTEHPESVILNILRSIHLSSPNAPGDQTTKITGTQQFVDLFNDQQEHILRAAEDLLPDTARPTFVERMVECIRRESFLVCSREVLWPTLSEYFPRLPSFPNFGAQATDSKPISPQNLTDTSPLSETDIKVGQHGDATVTTTHTRFFPIFSEHPEGVILKILRAVQHATPDYTGNSMISSRSPEIMSYFTEEQSSIVQIAESLLPESVRPVFVERMVSCVRKNAFLECTRDIAWPTIAQFFPRLPNFPDFRSSESKPRTSILLRNVYSKNQLSDKKFQDIPNSAMESAEDKIENVLKELVSKEDASARLDNSYLDASNPVIGDLLTAREINIMKLTEKAIPDSVRRAYITNMLECVRSNNFMTCTQYVSWPTLKQYAPALPGFDQLFGQIPGVSAIPDFAGQISDLTGQFPTFPGVGSYPFAEFPSQITAIPGAIQGGIPAGIQDGISQIPGISEFPSLGGLGFPSYVKRLPAATLQTKPQEQTIQPRLQLNAEQTYQISGVSVAANTPSVDESVAVPGYFGQPSSILIDISKEKVHLSDIEQQRGPSPGSVLSDQSSTKRRRRRRSAERLSNFYYETDGQTVERTFESMNNTFPNITESEFLQLLVNISRSKAVSEQRPEEAKTEYFVDTLNSTIKNSLTADQYEILKIVEILNEQNTNRGLLTRVIQCIRSLSFIRCMGIFVWPMITSTVPSLLGLPSLPVIPGLGLLGRSTESEVENFFGISTSDFEKELLAKKESVENILLDWYKRLMEDKFQTNIGFLKVNGYGNGEVGISFNGFREGRATKIKDNKNLPSILTIISDIMEEVLDQRPDNEKIKNKEKRERSLDDVQEADFQLLKESDEYADIKRSINDDQIITMFLDKIKANASDFAEGDVTQYLNMEDAYNAFGVLFGTRLNDKFASRLKAFTEEHLRSLNRENPEEDRAQEFNAKAENAKVAPWKEEEISYDLEKESTEGQEARKREHRAKSNFHSLLNKYSDKYARSIAATKVGDPHHDNRIKDTIESFSDKDARSELRLQLPSLREDVISRKITSAVVHLGKAMKMKMSNMLPGIGFVISFLIQTALAHARAAASMAGMISNMALASAMFGMLRQSMFGSDNPQVKYVYDNDKTGPGITWPHNEGYYHGK